MDEERPWCESKIESGWKFTGGEGRLLAREEAVGEVYLCVWREYMVYAAEEKGEGSKCQGTLVQVRRQPCSTWVWECRSEIPLPGR